MRLSHATTQTCSDHAPAGGRRQRLNAAALVALSLAACGGGAPDAQAPIQREGPEDQILRVGKTWEARWAEQGFLTPPSPIALFDTKVTSRLVFVRGQKSASETLVFDATFKLQSGVPYACQARTETKVTLVYGDRAGEPAVQMTRGPLRLSRTCDKLGFPEPELAVPTTKARFALRGDKLVAFDPPTERREYLPAD